MKRLKPNIDGVGRAFRAATALLLFVAAYFGWQYAWWLGAMLAIYGAFVLFEALAGWCVMRACGFRTRF